MIFELCFEHRGFAECLAFFLENILSKQELNYTIFEKSKEELRVWIEYEEIEKIEYLSLELSNSIPQSIYLDEVSAHIFENKTLPTQMNISPLKRTPHFCPQCLNTQEEICPVCLQPLPQISEALLQQLAQKLLEGKHLALITPSGEHILTLAPSERVYCLDIEKILEICTLSAKELRYLGSYEKPILRVRAYEQKRDYLSLSLAPDLVLLKLFEILKAQGVAFVYGAMDYHERIELSEIVGGSDEIVVYENEHFAYLRTWQIDQGLVRKFHAMQSRDKAFLSTILAEHSLERQNILNCYFSLEGGDRVCLYNAQTQWFNEVMRFDLPKDLYSLIDEIYALDENSQRLVLNYKKHFPHLLEHNYYFENFKSGIYGIWEIAKVILGLRENPLYIASHHLHQRGVAIDYVFEKDSLIAQKFNLARCIRSGMSFKLAGTPDELIALGYIESFSFLPSKIYIALRDWVEIEGISWCGDLFAHKMMGDFLYFNNRQIPLYHNLHFPLLFEDEKL